MSMTLEEAERFVKAMRRQGGTVFWDGWTLCAFKAHPDAMLSVKGHWHRATERWGYLDRFTPDSSGKYTVRRPKQYL